MKKIIVCGLLLFIIFLVTSCRLHIITPEQVETLKDKPYNNSDENDDSDVGENPPSPAPRPDASEHDPPATISNQPDIVVTTSITHALRIQVDVTGREGTYTATFTNSSGTDVTMTGTYGVIESIPNFTPNTQYTLTSMTDDSTGDSLDLTSSELKVTSHQELIKFTSHNGNTAGGGAYTLSVMGRQYPYSVADNGFKDVLTYYTVNGDSVSSTLNGEVVLDINSDRDVVWNYCDQATEKSCRIVYKITP